jgi:predicted transposase YbfD/YdcC
LATLVLVLRITETEDRVTTEASYYLSSLPPKVKALAKAIRQHWSIESQLHWILDVTFTEDASRIRKRHAPQTSAMLRRLAVSILSQDTSLKDTIRGKRYRASLSTDTLERIFLGFIEIRCDCRGILGGCPQTSATTQGRRESPPAGDHETGWIQVTRSPCSHGLRLTPSAGAYDGVKRSE